jgi:hypothetical protein
LWIFRCTVSRLFIVSLPLFKRAMSGRGSSPDPAIRHYFVVRFFPRMNPGW